MRIDERRRMRIAGRVMEKDAACEDTITVFF